MKHGIKETKEGIVGLMEVLILLTERFHDGAQISDFAAIWGKLQNDPDFQAKLMAAYDGAQQIPSEMGDLDLEEGIELAGLVLAYLPRIVTALKKNS